MFGAGRCLCPSAGLSLDTLGWVLTVWALTLPCPPSTTSSPLVSPEGSSLAPASQHRAGKFLTYVGSAKSGFGGSTSLTQWLGSGSAATDPAPAASPRSRPDHVQPAVPAQPGDVGARARRGLPVGAEPAERAVLRVLRDHPRRLGLRGRPRLRHGHGFRLQHGARRQRLVCQTGVEQGHGAASD